MSTETKKALDEAIQNHIQDVRQNGVIVTGYVLYGKSISAENIESGTTSYFDLYSNPLDHDIALGLSSMLQNKLLHEGLPGFPGWGGLFDEDEDDD